MKCLCVCVCLLWSLVCGHSRFLLCGVYPAEAIWQTDSLTVSFGLFDSSEDMCAHVCVCFTTNFCFASLRFHCSAAVHYCRHCDAWSIVEREVLVETDRQSVGQSKVSRTSLNSKRTRDDWTTTDKCSSQREHICCLVLYFVSPTQTFSFSRWKRTNSQRQMTGRAELSWAQCCAVHEQ